MPFPAWRIGHFRRNQLNFPAKWEMKNDEEDFTAYGHDEFLGHVGCSTCRDGSVDIFVFSNDSPGRGDIDEIDGEGF